MIRTKVGVSLDSVDRLVFSAIATADTVLHWVGVDECWITSVNDGVHMDGSRHGLGLAFDMRSHDLTERAKRDVLDDLSRQLGGDWDVVLEYVGEANEHFHAEYDPR